MNIVLSVLYLVPVIFVFIALTLRDQAAFKPNLPTSLRLRNHASNFLMSLIWFVWLGMAIWYTFFKKYP